MKYAILVFAATASILNAKIGETPEQCAKRYGDLVEKSLTGSSLRFVKDGIETILRFDGGKCVVAGYSLIFLESVANIELGKGPRFNKEQSLALLKLNSGGSEWIQKEPYGYDKEFDGQYQTKDGKLHARINFTGVNIEEVAAHERDVELTKPGALSKTIESFGK